MAGLDFARLVGCLSTLRARFWLVSRIARGLAEVGDVERAVDAAFLLPEAQLRWDVLSEVASVLADEGDCEGAVKVFMRVRDDDEVLRRLLDFWHCVDERLGDVLESYGVDGGRVLGAVRRVGNYAPLEWLSFLVKAGRVEEALEVARGLERKCFRAEGLMRVAVGLAEVGDERCADVLDEALHASLEVPYEEFEDIVSSAALDFASVGKGDVALDLAYKIDDDYEFADVLVRCLPHFEGKLLESTVEEILESVGSLTPDERDRILLSLFERVGYGERVSQPLVERIIDLVTDDALRGVFQVYYAFTLRERDDAEGFRRFYEEGMKRLKETRGKVRFATTFALVPAVSKASLDEFTRFVDEIPDGGARSIILADLSMEKSSLGETEEALRLARMVSDPLDKSAALSKLAAALAEDNFEKALNVAREIPDRSARGEAFSLLFKSAYKRGEFNENLFGNVLSSVSRNSWEETAQVLGPAVEALASGGDARLEQVVRVLAEVDNLEPFEEAVRLLGAGELRSAIGSARRGHGLYTLFVLSAAAVESLKTRSASFKKIVNEAVRMARRLRASHEWEVAVTTLAAAYIAAGRFQEALDLVYSRKTGSLSYLSLLAAAAQLNSDLLPRMLSSLKEEFKGEGTFFVLSYLLDLNLFREFEELLSRVDIPEETLPLLMDLLELRGNSEIIEKFLKNLTREADKVLCMAKLSMRLFLEGERQRAERTMKEAVERFYSLPEEELEESLYLPISPPELVTCVGELEEVLEKFSEKTGEDITPLSKIGDLMSAGRVEEAVDAFQGLIGEYSVPEEIASAAMILAGRQDRETAQKCIDKMLETEDVLDLSSTTLAGVLFDFAFSGGDPEMVLGVVERNWSDAASLLLNMALFYARHDTDKLERIIERVDLTSRRILIASVSPILATENPEKLEELIGETSTPTRDTALALLANEYARRGKLEEAIRVLKQISANKNFIEALRFIALNLMRKKSRKVASATRR